MKAAIITSSDSGYAGEREDKSGSVIQEILEVAPDFRRETVCRRQQRIL